MAFLTVTAYVIFHEMMHSDLISWSKNNKMHIYDMRFRLEGAARDKDIYGPLLCKVLARWNNVEEPEFVGRIVSQNGFYMMLKQNNLSNLL